MDLPINLARALTVLLLVAISVQAEDQPVFEVKDAKFSLQDTLLLLDSKVSIELPDYISKAVDQGFAVPLSFEVEFLEIRKYWLDKKVVSLKQQYLFHYLPMLDAYVIADINQGQRHYFNDREQAVNSLRVIYQYPMLDIGNIDAGLDIYARLRFGLDIDELPLPLKSSSLWDNDWDLQSEWYDWQFDQVLPRKEPKL